MKWIAIILILFSLIGCYTERDVHVYETSICFDRIDTVYRWGMPTIYDHVWYMWDDTAKHIALHEWRFEGRMYRVGDCRTTTLEY